MKIGDKVRMRIDCLQEKFIGEIIAVKWADPHVFYVKFNRPVIGPYGKPKYWMNVREKDLEVIE